MLSRKQTRGGSGELPPPHQDMNKEQEKDMKNQDDRVALFRLNTEEGRREYAARFTRVIRRSEADGCFIGSLPEVDGWCTHAESAEACLRNLDECALLAVEDFVDGEADLQPPGGCVILPPSRFNVSKHAGAEVARLRHRLGLSQTDFAAALGVTRSTLCKWERGERRPDGASARLLSIVERHPEVLQG